MNRCADRVLPRGGCFGAKRKTLEQADLGASIRRPRHRGGDTREWRVKKEKTTLFHAAHFCERCGGRRCFSCPRLSIRRSLCTPHRRNFGQWQCLRFDFADFRVTPHYPAKSPLDDVLRKVIPGADEYVTEKYAFEIMRLLEEWSRALKERPPALSVLAKFLDASLQACSLVPAQQNTLRSGNGIEILRRKFCGRSRIRAASAFLKRSRPTLASMSRVETAEFEITGIEEIAGSSPSVRIDIRYDFVGARIDAAREQRIGHWLTQWSRDAANGWRVRRWEATEETFSRARAPIFIDITSQASAKRNRTRNRCSTESTIGARFWTERAGSTFTATTAWRSEISTTTAWMISTSASHPGLPNRLYHNRGDGTFEDVTEKSGVGVLDGTACALFADFENKGLQDLLVVCGSGPLLFLNQGKRKILAEARRFPVCAASAGNFHARRRRGL